MMNEIDAPHAIFVKKIIDARAVRPRRSAMALNAIIKEELIKAHIAIDDMESLDDDQKRDLKDKLRELSEVMIRLNDRIDAIPEDATI